MLDSSGVGRLTGLSGCVRGWMRGRGFISSSVTTVTDIHGFSFLEKHSLLMDSCQMQLSSPQLRFTRAILEGKGMKLNIAYPTTGCQKVFEIDDEKKLRIFYEKRIAQEVEADALGDEWKGYVLRITGGNDKQGFPMKQGVLTNGRVRLLLSKGHSCYRSRRDGERKRKSVRGCIVDANLSALALIIVKKGEQEIPGLTDTTVPRRLGPKRASKIRKLFNLTKNDDVRKYVIRRKLPEKEGKKPRSKAPKIQRLITPVVLQRKRRRLAMKIKRSVKRREEEAQYHKMMTQYSKERQAAKIARRRSSASRRESESVRQSKSSK